MEVRYSAADLRDLLPVVGGSEERPPALRAERDLRERDLHGELGDCLRTSSAGTRPSADAAARSLTGSC